MAQYCANQSSRLCHIYVPKWGDYAARLFILGGGESQFLHIARWIILLYSATFCKRIGSEVKTLRAFNDSDYAFGARVQKTNSWRRARSCCIPELLALKGLTYARLSRKLLGNAYSWLPLTKRVLHFSLHACGFSFHFAECPRNQKGIWWENKLPLLCCSLHSSAPRERERERQYLTKLIRKTSIPCTHFIWNNGNVQRVINSIMKIELIPRRIN